MENNKNEIMVMTGAEAIAHVTNLKRKSGLKVYIEYFTPVTYVERTDVSVEHGDTYGGKEFSSLGPVLRLTWNQFLSFCEDADHFSGLKMQRYRDVGDDDTSCRLGTGISIGTNFCEEYNFVTVTINR